jgi:hypothetical protein
MMPWCDAAKDLSDQLSFVIKGSPEMTLSNSKTRIAAKRRKNRKNRLLLSIPRFFAA